MIAPKDWSTMKKLMFLQQTGGGSVVIEDTVSGNPVVFTTDLAKPLKRLALSLLPRQSGTGDPSPSNIRPLLPWGEVGTWTGGKNLFDITQYFYKYDTMVIDGATSSIIDSRVYADNSSRIKFSQVYKPGTYTMKGNISGEGCKGLRFLCSSQITGSIWNNSYGSYWKNFGSGNEITFTLEEPSTIGLVLITGVATESSTISNLQIEAGSQSSSFTPYIPIIPHPVNLGKNLLPSTEAGTFTHNGITFTADGNGGYTMDGESTATAYVNIPLKQAVTLGQGEFYVHLMNNVRNSYIAVAFMNGSSQVASASFNAVDRIAKIDALSGATFDKIRLYVNGTQKVENCKVSPMICLDSTASEYQPYLPPVYGASLDLTTGEVWGTWGIIQLLPDWNWSRNSVSNPNGSLFVTSAYQMSDFDGYDGLKCNVFVQSPNGTQATSPSNTIWWNKSGTPRVIFGTTESTAEDFKQFLTDTPVYVCAKLKTPVLLATLTPQQISALVGVNTVWSDADNVDVTYLKKG